MLVGSIHHMATNEESKSVNIEVGKRILAARRRQKLTQRDLALKIDLSYQGLQKLESGATPVTVERLVQLAEVMNRPVTDFIPPRRTSSKSDLPILDEDERTLIQSFRRLPSNSLRLKVLELLREIPAEGQKPGR
jgi:transcriptional regulator with XRE-family HTH domain